MNAREKMTVTSCVHELMKDDGDFLGAVHKLGALVGIRFEASEILRTDVTVDLGAIAAGPNRPFWYHAPKVSAKSRREASADMRADMYGEGGNG